MSNISKLQHWYFKQCDGDWERTSGIKIESSGKPGWSIEIDLTNTALEDAIFDQTTIDFDSDSNWLICRVEDRVFKGACGPMMLDKLIDIFLEWLRE